MEELGTFWDFFHSHPLVGALVIAVVVIIWLFPLKDNVCDYW